MSKNQSARNSLIIGIVILAVITLICSISYIKTKKNIEKFNTVLGKDEEIGFTQVIQTIMNDNKFGTVDENARFAALAPNKGIIEIREKMFATQVSDIYLNAQDYLGKTIKLEGIFKSEQYYEDREPYRFVVRYGPGGCCGFDANVGFEVKWAEENVQPYPAAESWVEAAGELKIYKEGNYLYLDLVSLTVLSRRGTEIVVQ